MDVTCINLCSWGFSPLMLTVDVRCIDLCCCGFSPFIVCLGVVMWCVVSRDVGNVVMHIHVDVCVSLLFGLFSKMLLCCVQFRSDVWKP